MNDRFFTLPPERQRAILNAAFKVFSQSDYRHASMQQVTDEGGISKSLLFHYFRNKQELYLHLWDVAAQRTAQATIPTPTVPTKLMPSSRSLCIFDVLKRI